MDRESVEKQTRHATNVRRIELQLATMSPEDIEKRVDTLTTVAAARWESCHRSFAGLIQTLNRGNRLPIDSFNIRLKHEDVDNSPVDTYVHVWNDRKNGTYNVRPYLRLEGNIVDKSIDTEKFGSIYTYKYGTYYSQSAQVVMRYDGHEATATLTRINGYLVEADTLRTNAVFISALEDAVLPELENTENTLILIWGAVTDRELNPEHAYKVQLPEH